MFLFYRKENENNKSETFKELEQIRSKQLNKTSNVKKVRQDLELLGNTTVISSETETESSSNKNIKDLAPVTGDIDSEETSKIMERDSKAPARGRKRFGFLTKNVIVFPLYREFKSSKEKEKTTVRSKSLSSIKNVRNYSFLQRLNLLLFSGGK